MAELGTPVQESQNLQPLGFPKLQLGQTLPGGAAHCAQIGIPGVFSLPHFEQTIAMLLLWVAVLGETGCSGEGLHYTLN